MNSSMFSSGELPPRKCENLDTRNGTISSVHAAAIECHQMNFRDGFHGNQMRCSSGSSHDMSPNMHDIHNEAALYGSGHVQRAPVRLTCSCSGQHPEIFHDHDHHQPPSLKRCCHGITGSSTANSNQIGHLHNVCDRGCRGSVAIRRERSSFANCGVERAKTTSRNSVFVDTVEFERNAAAVGSMSHFPSTPREVETRSSSLHTGSMANSTFHMQTKTANNQTMLYGWFLMKPLRENYNTDHSTFSSVAIGGYRCPRMEEKDFVATADVVQRLERWKLRTSDGLEFGLMGMINIEKSVANGFSPALVQSFSIGFPSAWMYMLLNLQKGVSKVLSSGLLSPSASPTNSAGTTGVIRYPMGDCRGISMTSRPEANLVQSILQSSLFTAAPDSETKTAILRRYCTATATPSQDGGSSDANSGPQVHLGHEQVDSRKDGDQTFLEADFANVALQPKEPPSCRDRSPLIPEGVAVREGGEDPGTSSQAQIPKQLKGCSFNTDDVEVGDGREDPSGPSLIAVDNIANAVHFEVSNGVAATCDSEKEAAELGSLAPDHVPCTPQLETRERMRTDADAQAADASSIEPAVAPERLQHVEINKLSMETTVAVVKTPVTASVADRVSPVHTRDRRKRLRSTSDSPLADFPVVESISVPIADPPGTRDKRKRRTRESLSPPAADASSIDPVVAPESLQHVEINTLSRETTKAVVNTPVTASVSDRVSPVHTRDRRKRLRSTSDSPLVDFPVVESISVPVADPSGTRDKRKRRTRESLSPPAADALSIDPVVAPESLQHVEINTLISETSKAVVHTPVAASVADRVSLVHTRDKRKRLRSTSDSPLVEFPVVESISVPIADPPGTRDKRKRRTRELLSPPAADASSIDPVVAPESLQHVEINTLISETTEAVVNTQFTGSVADPVSPVHSRDSRRRLRSTSDSPLADFPVVESISVPVADPSGTRDKNKRPKRESLSPVADINMGEPNQSCKETTEVVGRARRKRYKVSRNYYQRGKKKSSAKRCLEKGTLRSDGSTPALETPIEEETVVEKKTEEVKKKVGRSPILTRKNTPKFSSSLETPESLAGNSNVKKSRQAKKSIVPPPLPPPRVADKSKVTDAYGLKRSRRGRVLVPPLATWRSQSIKYDTDGGIIAISDGFSGTDDESCTGYHNFKSPADKGARTMQRRLCKAADRSRKA